MGKYICIKEGITYVEGGPRLFRPDGGKTVLELEDHNAPPHLFQKVEEPTTDELLDAPEAENPKRVPRKKKE